MINYSRKGLARELGVGIETLRYYEKMELIKPPVRTGNGYRVYTEEDAFKVKHILGAKKFGFSLKEIKAVIDKSEKTEINDGEIEFLLRNKIKDIDNQIDDLKKLKDLILEYIDPARTDR